MLAHVGKDYQNDGSAQTHSKLLGDGLLADALISSIIFVQTISTSPHVNVLTKEEYYSGGYCFAFSKRKKKID